AKLAQSAPAAAASMTIGKTTRPPNRSVAMPTGSRKIDPVRTGIPSSQPICALSKAKTWLSTRNVTSTPFITHTAKHTVKASVFIERTVAARRRSVMSGLHPAMPPVAVPHDELRAAPQVRDRRHQDVHEACEREDREHRERAQDVQLDGQRHARDQG